MRYWLGRATGSAVTSTAVDNSATRHSGFERGEHGDQEVRVRAPLQPSCASMRVWARRPKRRRPLPAAATAHKLKLSLLQPLKWVPPAAGSPKPLTSASDFNQLSSRTLDQTDPRLFSGVYFLQHVALDDCQKLFIDSRHRLERKLSSASGACLAR